MKKLMAWLLAAVLLLAMAACGEPDPQLPGEDPTQGAAVLQEPPDARLIHRSGSITLTPAGFDWRFPNENGTMGGVIADHAHILDCENLLTPIYAAGEYGKLVFPDQPDSIEVVCWPDTAWESGGASQRAACDGMTFELQKGGWLYEITARWEEGEGRHSGTVSYYAYIVGGYAVELAGDYPVENTLPPACQPGEKVTVQLPTLTEHYYRVLVNETEVEMDREASDMTYSYYTFTMPQTGVCIRIEDHWVAVPAGA